MIGGTPNAIFNEIRVASRTRRVPRLLACASHASHLALYSALGASRTSPVSLLCAWAAKGMATTTNTATPALAVMVMRHPLKPPPWATHVAETRSRGELAQTHLLLVPAGVSIAPVGVSARWEPTPCPRDLGPRYAALAGSLISRRGGRRRAALKRDRERLRPRPPEPPAGCRARSRG